MSGEVGALAVAAEFVDPNRTLATYNAAIGGEESFEAFVEEARKQRRGYWRDEYTAPVIVEYFREGFTPTNLDYTPDGEYYGAVPY